MNVGKISPGVVILAETRLPPTAMRRLSSKVLSQLICGPLHRLRERSLPLFCRTLSYSQVKNRNRQVKGRGVGWRGAPHEQNLQLLKGIESVRLQRVSHVHSDVSLCKVEEMLFKSPSRLAGISRTKV